MPDKLSPFIDSVYREPYHLIGNNCINESLRIKAKAEELGKRADLICCLAIVPMKRWHNFPLISPHVYSEIDGEKIDVALDLGHEKIFCQNSEVKIVMPVNISQIKKPVFRRAKSSESVFRRGVKV